MKNFVFISPNFPTNYWKFCHHLKANGLRVLGIGDQPYDDLLPELKESLHEYYKVNSLENYDEVYRAMGYFIHKYGRIDWLESNNEYWLERDAALRTDFHITSGFQAADMAKIKCKSSMKAFYKKAGIATAPYYLVKDLAGCKRFIKKVGFPVVAKPDNGVGASDTWKIKDMEGLERFMEKKVDGVQYIMEEFIHAEVNSYDAIFNSNGDPIFETGNVTPMSIMDIVNENDNSIYYIQKDLPEDTRAAGRATARSFGVKNRFVHFEFFRLTQDQDVACLQRIGRAFHQIAALAGDEEKDLHQLVGVHGMIGLQRHNIHRMMAVKFAVTVRKQVRHRRSPPFGEHFTTRCAYLQYYLTLNAIPLYFILLYNGTCYRYKYA